MVRNSFDCYPAGLQYWRNKLPQTFHKNVDFYFRQQKCITDVPLRAFQYKCLHATLASRYKLQKWGIYDSAKCLECDVDDDICHSLYFCPRSQQVLRKLEQIVWEIDTFRITLDLETAMFGFPDPDIFLEKYNLLLLLYRYYLYASRREESIGSSPRGFSAYLRWKLRVLSVSWELNPQLRKYTDRYDLAGFFDSTDFLPGDA